MKSRQFQKKGFTLIEVLLVIALIGILAGMFIGNSIRSAPKARDAKRVQEVYQIAHLLLAYHSDYGKFPDNNSYDPDLDRPDCFLHGVNWDIGNTLLQPDEFLKPLIDQGYASFLPKEWMEIQDNLGSKCTYRYARVTDPCDGQCQGTYAILYARCESNHCPDNERPACCDGSSWTEGTGDNDKSDIIIFLKE